MDQCSDSLEHPEPLKVISHQIKGHWLLPACQNRYMCIHKASLMQTMCPPSAIFLLLLFTRMRLHMWDSLRHMYTHIISSILHWHKQLFYSCFTRNMHVKQTVTPLLPRQYTRIQSFSQAGCHKQAPVQQSRSVILLRWSGLSFPESLLAVKDWPFLYTTINPLVRALLCDSASSLWYLMKFILFYYTKDTVCVVVPIVWIYFHCSKPNTDIFLLRFTWHMSDWCKAAQWSTPFPSVGFLIGFYWAISCLVCTLILTSSTHFIAKVPSSCTSSKRRQNIVFLYGLVLMSRGSLY